MSFRIFFIIIPFGSGKVENPQRELLVFVTYYYKGDWKLIYDVSELIMF